MAFAAPILFTQKRSAMLVTLYSKSNKEVKAAPSQVKQLLDMGYSRTPQVAKKPEVVKPVVKEEVVESTPEVSEEVSDTVPKKRSYVRKTTTESSDE